MFTRTLYLQDRSWWWAGLIVSGSVISWTYQTAIFLAACVLFHLACSLQVIHFDDYAELLERESNISVLMGEHLILTHCLSKISHRFRNYLLVIFLIVTTALVVALMQIANAGNNVTFLNVGNFAVSHMYMVILISLFCTCPLLNMRCPTNCKLNDKRNWDFFFIIFFVEL